MAVARQVSFSHTFCFFIFCPPLAAIRCNSLRGFLGLETTVYCFLSRTNFVVSSGKLDGEISPCLEVCLFSCRLTPSQKARYLARRAKVALCCKVWSGPRSGPKTWLHQEQMWKKNKKCHKNLVPSDCLRNCFDRSNRLLLGAKSMAPAWKKEEGGCGGVDC
jgi:hypothetical protein